MDIGPPFIQIYICFFFQLSLSRVLAANFCFDRLAINYYNKTRYDFNIMIIGIPALDPAIKK